MAHKHKKLIQSHEEYNNLTKISIKSIKACDITGIPTKYTDPRSNLNFFDVSVYDYINSMDPAEKERYYEVSHYKRE